MKAPMKPCLVLFAGLVALSALTPVAAQTYQWKDSSGRTIISDTPPPNSVKDKRSVSSAPAAPVASSPDKALADQSLEFKKRQQENKEKADKGAKEQAAAAERKENCERSRRQLSVLESGQRMSTTDASGERRYIDDTERQKEIERSRKIIADSCK